jgi:hypothetical protein
MRYHSDKVNLELVRGPCDLKRGFTFDNDRFNFQAREQWVCKYFPDIIAKL